MLRVLDSNLSRLAEAEIQLLFNVCMAATVTNDLSNAIEIIEGKLDAKEWFVYTGGHHVAIHKRAENNSDAVIRLVELTDKYLCVSALGDSSLETERLAIGLDLHGCGR